MDTPKETLTLVFTYGTLKQDYPNHIVMQDLIDNKDAIYVGPHNTHVPYPLVFGPHGIPYLINLPGSGHKVKGEIYAVSAHGLNVLDKFEETGSGLYERLPIGVESEENIGMLVKAESYYVHRSFGIGLWERFGKDAVIEFKEEQAKKYVKKDNLSLDDVLDELRAISSS